MLIDCDTCTARVTGCSDCVVTVLLGAPPGWGHGDSAGGAGPGSGRSSEVISLTRRATVSGSATAEDAVVPRSGVVVEFDEVERRAVRALADGGLVPPLRHREGPARGDGRSRTG